MVFVFKMTMLRLLVLWAFGLLFTVCRAGAQPSEPAASDGGFGREATDGALKRLEQEDASSEAAPRRLQGEEKRLHRRLLRDLPEEEGKAVLRLGVPYREDWTFRAGATRLRLPAYEGWINGMRRRGWRERFGAIEGVDERLVGLLLNRDFVKASLSTSLNFYGTVWVLQGWEFKAVNVAGFREVKDAFAREIESARASGDEGDVFRDLEDLEDLEDLADGRFVRAQESDQQLTYLRTVEKPLAGEMGAGFVERYIEIKSLALVEGKVLRVDFARALLAPEDLAGLLSFNDQFLADFRRLNALSEDRRVSR